MKSDVWAGVSIRTFFYGAFWLFIAINRGVWIGYSWGVVLAFSLAENCLFAWVASRFFVAARHTGELELLMTTPEGARTIVTSQWKWLKHLFRWPIVVLVAPWVLLSINGLGRQQATFAYFSASLTVLNTVAGVVALLWAGLWFGWSERSQARAVVRIVLLAVAAPYLLGQLLLRAGLLFNPPRVSFDPFSPWRFLVLTSPQIVNLLFFLWLIRWCRRRLDAEVGHVPVGGGIGEQIALYLRGFLSYHD